MAFLSKTVKHKRRKTVELHLSKPNMKQLADSCKIQLIFIIGYMKPTKLYIQVHIIFRGISSMFQSLCNTTTLCILAGK